MSGLNGTQEALACGKCTGELRIVCENGCDDPLEHVRKSKGSVAAERNSVTPPPQRFLQSRGLQ